MLTFAVLNTVIAKPEHKTLRYTYSVYIVYKGNRIFHSLIVSKTLMHNVSKISHLYKKLGRMDGDCIYSSENIDIIPYRYTLHFWVECI